MIRPRPRFHPSGITLHCFAEGTLRSTSSLWVKRHLASCHECRVSVSFTRSLREALETLPPTTSIDASVIDRAIADRRAGERTVLPASDTAAAAVRQRGLLRVVAMAAAVVLLALAVYRGRSWRSAERSNGVPRADARQSLPAPTDEFAVSEFFLPKTAFATELHRGDSLAPPLTLDGTQLRAGVIRYARFERLLGGARRRVGSESVELSEARIEGQSVWRVVQRRQIADTQHVETLYVDRTTLRILGRTVRVQPYMHYVGITVRQRLVGDHLTGWMQTDSGLGRPIARDLSPRSGPYLSDALAPVLLGATALGSEWRARFSILGWAVRDGDVSFPAQLRVVGEERVTVPAGTFDCWKVAVEASLGMQTYWVRKSDGVGVRALLERGDAMRELVLTR